eukprot:COSAG05_NODE_1843_length_3978_cov_2.302913_2_plen_112_part_00
MGSHAEGTTTAQAGRDSGTSPQTNLQDEELRDHIMLKIAADVDAYAGKIVRNVDLWAEVFDLLRAADVQANYDPLNGDRRLGTAMMAAQQLVTAQTNAGLDSLGMTTARLR